MKVIDLQEYHRQFVRVLRLSAQKS